MLQICKQITGRKFKEEILYLDNKLSKIFSNYIEDGTNKTSKLYKDKKDFGDIDFFGQLKNNITLTENNILDILSNNGFVVGKELKDILINDFNNIENIDKTSVVYKNDLKYTLLVYDIAINQYFCINLHLINEKESGINFQSYFKHYKKSFFSYYLGIILKKFWIKYSSKDVFYKLPQESF